MPRCDITAEIAYAAGRDAGNRSMRAAGRSAWNDTDYQAACLEFARLTVTGDASGGKPERVSHERANETQWRDSAAKGKL